MRMACQGRRVTVDDSRSGDGAGDGAVTEAAAEPSVRLAARIQDTLIGQGITARRVEEHVAAAVRYGFNAVIVPGCWVGLARGLLTGSQVRIGSILDFPYGSATTAERVAGAAALLQAGVDEIDSTVNIGYLLSGRRTEFAADLAAVVRAAAPVPVKFMLELPLLDSAQRDVAVAAAVDAGAAYVKNASRGAVGIADPASIGYLRRSVPESVGVKASGGIKTVEQVRELLAAGADLIGTSSGVAIVTGRRGPAGSLYSY
jgi:deoxyribose-phosphate aldolase